MRLARLCLLEPRDPAHPTSCRPPSAHQLLCLQAPADLLQLSLLPLVPPQLLLQASGTAACVRHCSPPPTPTLPVPTSAPRPGIRHCCSCGRASRGAILSPGPAQALQRGIYWGAGPAPVSGQGGTGHSCKFPAGPCSMGRMGRMEGSSWGHQMQGGTSPPRVDRLESSGGPSTAQHKCKRHVRTAQKRPPTLPRGMQKAPIPRHRLLAGNRISPALQGPCGSCRHWFL